MEIVAAQRLTFRYPDAARPALAEVDLSVRKGEFVVLCGASGSGKTTLLRHFKRELAPVGERSGSVRYDGSPLADLPDGRAAEEIGFVFQHPESQIVMDTVWHELAFAMENRGYPEVVMRQRLAELSSFFGLEPLMQRSVHELSGGQTQLVNLASVLLLQPRLAAARRADLAARSRRRAGVRLPAAPAERRVRRHRRRERAPARRHPAAGGSAGRHGGRPRPLRRRAGRCLPANLGDRRRARAAVRAVRLPAAGGA
ncbi:ABC transporter ATP-binding protein [Cohnella rhizosphaerae]|uniref:ABC transporter ATP-binding protein n=1 Tax=Cohnella rhizosphaerae TaxID=1457232 RepID=UPI003B8A8E1C